MDEKNGKTDGLERVKASLIGQIRPGDTIVLKMKEMMPGEAIARTTEYMENVFPGTKILVLGPGTTMEVYREKTEDDQI